MKKKIISICLIVALVATAIVGASLAYFTDTDEAINTMTMGNVKIDLTEKDRYGKPFVDGQALLPIVGSAQGPLDNYFMPTAENYIDKMINVTNTGSVDAYVRVILAIPSAFNEGTTADRLVHQNSDIFGSFWLEETCGTVTYQDVSYDLYNYTHKYALDPAEEGWENVIVGLYMDSRVDAVQNENGTITYSMVGSDGEPISATVDADYEYKILAFAQGVQADGFDTPAEALNAAFGAVTATNNPWYVAP